MCCFGQVLVGTVLDAADNKMLKDVEMEVPNSVETRKHSCSKTDDDGMQ